MAGPFGDNSRIDNIWMEHFTTGPWIGQGNSPQVNGLVIDGCRIRDLYADGVNLNTGTSNTTVQQCAVRNVGDDAFASWSSASTPNTSNVFQFDTVQVTWRANCYAIYGGTNISVEDSICADTVTYPGIFIDQDFSSTPFAGTTSIARDTILRGGGNMYGRSWGALTVDGNQMSSAITGSPDSNRRYRRRDATPASISSRPNDAIRRTLTLTDVTIANPGTYGISAARRSLGDRNGDGDERRRDEPRLWDGTLQPGAERL